jgi:hypothetical protein
MGGEQDAVTKPAPPDSFVRDCAELGFTIGGWDETTAGIFGHGAEFVGTHAEIMAFLRGWLGCETRNTRTVVRYMLALNAGSPIYNRTRSVVVPGSSFIVTARPQRGGFRGDRVAIPDSIAEHFTIDDITVGNRSQYLQAGSIDGALFAARIDTTPIFKLTELRDMHRLEMAPGTADAFGRELSMDAAETAMDVTMMVTAKHTMPIGTTFMAIVLGTFVAPKRSQGQREARALIGAWQQIIDADMERRQRAAAQETATEPVSQPEPPSPP